MNTVLDLAQGAQGQAADPVAACKAVQASGLDPESKQQVLLALEQGRINTTDEPQRVNALAEDIIQTKGQGQSADTEMALTRAMAAGQLTQKSRERLTQLKAQLDGPYGSMLQHAYAGLAAQFGQDGSAAAQQQLAQQHLQAAFNQALTSNNFQELERLSHPDTVAANDVTGLFPKETQAGLKHKALPEFDAYDADGNAFRAVGDLFTWDVGLSVRDWRSVVRICNIPVDKLNLSKKDAGFIDLHRLTIQAKNKIPTEKRARMKWYCNEDVMTAMEIQASDAGNVQLVYKDLFRSSGVAHIHGVPVRQCDAILSKENALVAA